MLDQILQADGQLLLAVQNLRMPWLDPVVSLYTQLGNAGLLWIALSLAMVLYKPTRRAGAAALMAMALGLLITNITIKPLVERARPWLAWPIEPLVVERDPNSFPSGHTSAAFAFALGSLRELPRRWMKVCVVVLAVLMGLSRLYVGVHYPSDVLMGFVVGDLAGLCGWLVSERISVWRQKRSTS